MRKYRYHSGLYATVGIILLMSAFFPCLTHFDNFTTNVNAEPPAGYNHRPLDEFFTSLACPPCVNGADPAQDGAWEDWGHDPAVRYNWVVFHTYAPSGDNLSTSEAAARQVEYNNGNPLYSNPTVIYDGGYIEENTNDAEQVKAHIDSCGNRDVIREVEVYIEQEFTTDGIQFHYQIHYLGGEGSTPDGTPTIDDIDASVYIFVVEDDVIDYSTVINEDYLCHNVFREYALEDDSFTMVEGDWYNSSIVWNWPDPDPTIPIKPHDVTGIIGIFDTEDTSSGEPTVTMPRLSNSANYKSTLWDWEEEGPSITNVQANHNEFELTISADLADPDGISSAWLVYNVTDVAYNWTILEMDIDAGNQASVTFTESEGDVVNYTILAFDSNHLQSQTILDQHSLPNYPPAQITDLTATTGSVEGEVDLTWTAPGSDDNEGTASKYHIRYSNLESITEANWDSVMNVTSPPTPQIAGSTEEFTVEGLTPDQTYYFAIRAEDDVGNIASVSNSPDAVAPSDPGDVTPPGKINDLQAEQGENEGEVLLTWIAPGDDDNTGTALKYYIRYSQDKISTENDWDSASVVSNPPAPQVAGSQESHTIKYLDPDDILYFAIRAEDDMELVGPISNSPSVTVPGADTTPPAKITDLAASPGDNEGEVTLTWTAPGDDGNSGGKAEEYIIKYSLSDITDEGDFNDATEVTGEPSPKNPGETETFTITDLTPDTKYYFAIVTEDEVPNPSVVSDSAYAVAAGVASDVIDITNIYHTPTNPTEDDEITITASVTGENTIDSVWLEYCLGEMCFTPVTMLETGSDIYSINLGQLGAGEYHYTVNARDNSENEHESYDLSFTVSVGDTDGDGYNDDEDDFPNDSTQWQDSDGDGYGDNPEGNDPDEFPNDPTRWSSPKEDETPWYESDTGIYLIGFLIVIIAIILILAAVLARSKKETVAEPPMALITQETPAEPAFTPMAVPEQEEISCPNCSTVFSIPLEPRPLEVQCPSCSIKGIID